MGVTKRHTAGASKHVSETPRARSQQQNNGDSEIDRETEGRNAWSGWLLLGEDLRTSNDPHAMPCVGVNF